MKINPLQFQTAWTTLQTEAFTALNGATPEDQRVALDSAFRNALQKMYIEPAEIIDALHRIR